MEDLRRGETIDQAIAKREGGLPILYSRVIRAGVESGELPATLLNLNQHLRLMGDTKRMMWEVTSYPLMILALAMTIASLLMILVIPRFKEIFKDFGTDLPGMTLLLMNVSEWFAHGRPPGWMIVWLTPIVIALIWHLLSYTRSGRVFRESVVLSIPIVGGVHRASLVAEIPAKRRDGRGDRHPASGCDEIKCGCNGEPLAFARRGVAGCRSGMRTFDLRGESVDAGHSAALWVLRAGGDGARRVACAIGTLSHSYESRAVHTQSMLRVLLYPALIIFSGGLIGFVVVSLFLPLVKLINSVSSGGR